MKSKRGNVKSAVKPIRESKLLRTHAPADLSVADWQRGLRRQFGREQAFDLENLSGDPWQALAQVGMQFVSALTAANDPNAPAHPWIERDPTTGARNLKVPLPPPETMRRLGDSLLLPVGALRSTTQ